MQLTQFGLGSVTLLGNARDGIKKAATPLISREVIYLACLQERKEGDGQVDHRNWCKNSTTQRIDLS